MFATRWTPQNLLAAFFQNKLAPYEAGVDSGGEPELANELRKKAEDLGLLALGLSEEVGGGLNTIDMCLCE